jgi:hypothetical protein
MVDWEKLAKEVERKLQKTDKLNPNPDVIVGTRKFRGTGKLLRKDLRDLPGDLVTEDETDESKVHALDPDHVQKDIIADYGKQEAPEEAPPEELETFHPISGDCGQEVVDQIILRSIKAILTTQYANMIKNRTIDLGVRHLWFPEDDSAHYELRRGNPPSPSDRPKHMRRLELAVDPTLVPERIKSRLRHADGGRFIVKALNKIEQFGRRHVLGLDPFPNVHYPESYYD